MAANPATVQDVAARWRPLTAQEEAVASTLLDDAWALLKHRVAQLESRLDAVPATLDAGLVRMVEVAMVLRVLRNPDGVRQEAIQDYSYSRDPVTASGALAVTVEELDLLAAAGADSAAFTIRPAYQVPAGSPELVAADWEWR